jgi:hypothetical protein
MQFVIIIKKKSTTVSTEGFFFSLQISGNVNMAQVPSSSQLAQLSL